MFIGERGSGGDLGFRVFREKSMITAQILLRAYYERSYEAMVVQHEKLFRQVDILLEAEINQQAFGLMEPEKVQAYRQACQAFIDERLEAYNPIGIQYTFDHSTSHQAAELEFQLDWYDSRAEFEELVASARTLVREGISEERLDDAVGQLIRQVGIFPDRSIITAYTDKPTLQKLPDYIVALAIEQIICRPETEE